MAKGATSVKGRVRNASVDAKFNAFLSGMAMYENARPLNEREKTDFEEEWGKYKAYLNESSNNNTLAGYISKRTGGDSLPELLAQEDFDRAEKNGYFSEVGFRTVSTDEQARQFMRGDVSFDGKGIYGDGHYIAMYTLNPLKKDNIREASLAYGHDGKSLMHIGIKKSAKIGTQQEIQKYLKANGLVDIQDNYAIAAKKMGLDGYRVEYYSYNGYFVLLNRKAAVVSRTVGSYDDFNRLIRTINVK